MEANEYTEFEDRRYVNPTLSRDEQMAFIDNLRNTQTANNEQIQTDTYNLGTHIPMTQGGLVTGATDPDSYFMKRYQTPQVDTQVATLKATAQAQALNDVLSNYQKQMKKRYNDAYNAYNKRKGSGSGGGSPDTLYPETGGDVTEKGITPLTAEQTVATKTPGTTTQVTDGGKVMWVIDNATGARKKYEKNSNGEWVNTISDYEQYRQRKLNQAITQGEAILRGLMQGR